LCYIDGIMEQAPKEENPILTIVLGVFMIAGAVWLFTYIGGKEAEGGSIRLNVLLMILYKIGGKWLMSGLIALAGVAIIVSGVRKKLQG
jgi:hypothetical protein